MSNTFTVPEVHKYDSGYFLGAVFIQSAHFFELDKLFSSLRPRYLECATINGLRCCIPSPQV